MQAVSTVAKQGVISSKRPLLWGDCDLSFGHGEGEIAVSERTKIKARPNSTGPLSAATVSEDWGAFAQATLYAKRV